MANAAHHLTPEAVLAGIPGWERADAIPLQGGLTNRAYLVDRAGERAVLKVDAATRRDPFGTRKDEGAAQAAAAHIGLAGAVIHADDTTLLVEYVDGTVWERDSFDEQSLAALAEALRRLHALPLTGRTFDARRAAQRYAGDVGDADPLVAERCLATIEAMPVPHNLCCCHNDLVAENIVSTPSLKLLDFEYACDNDPLFDLATVVAHHELSSAQADFLLDAYFDGDGQRWMPKLVEQERLYDALNWLWRASRPRAG